MRFTRKSSIGVIGMGGAGLLMGAFCLAGLGASGAAFARQASTTQQSSQGAGQSAPAQSASQASQPGANASSSTATGQSGTLTTDKQKESYALGMRIAHQLKSQPVDLDQDALVQGFKDEFSGGKMQLTDDQAETLLKQLSAEANAQEQAQQQKAAEANMKEGQDFLAANKSKEGVTVLPSGLQYKVETAGTGPKPTAADTVVCNYRGTFIDGKEFDNSYKRGQPVSFPVGGVIKGWTEALQLMPVGSKWQLFIPSDLAYGPSGRGGVIGPNQTLIFEVELLSIKGKQATP
jgi:FKBP-type peptidyl-prolyl cis-trans isomerase FklB